MRKGLVRVGAVVCVVALMGAAFVAGSTSEVRASNGQEVVYVATGLNFPDALGAGPVAALANAPVLLVSRDAIPAATLAELNRLEPERIVIVGGTAVVSEAVADALAALAFSPTVERLAGTDRYATAAAISESRFPADLDADTLGGHSPSDFLHTGDDLDADTLSGHPASDFLQESDYFLPFALGESSSAELAIGNSWYIVESIVFEAPAVLGTVVANSSVTAREATAGDGVECLIAIEHFWPMGEVKYWRSPGGLGNHGQLANTTVSDVGGSRGITVELLCRHVGDGSDDSAVLSRSLTAIWLPRA